MIFRQKIADKIQTKVKKGIQKLHNKWIQMQKNPRHNKKKILKKSNSEF